LNTKEEVLEKVQAEQALIAEQQKLAMAEQVAGIAEKGSKALQNVKFDNKENPYSPAPQEPA
jgi:hypothetical protein